MRSEKEKMLAGEFYDALDAELVAARGHARDLLQRLNRSGETEQAARRQILTELFGSGGDSVWMQPPFYCDYGRNIHLGQRVYFNFNCIVPILFGTGFAHRIHDDFGTVFARAIIPQRAFRQFDTSPTSQCANRSPNVADQQNQMR